MAGTRPIPIEKRFWLYVKKTRDCWLWLGSRNHLGYGQTSINGKGYRAHRISYELANGKPPKGLLICHKCDNPGCVKPSHLFAGTHFDNARDRSKKGRNRDQRGEKHNMAKLTKTAVIFIRKNCKMRGDQRKMMRKFGVGRSQVSRIVKKETWAWL